MFISYENNDVRECCLLLRPGSVNSSFSIEEIKDIRGIIADLKAAPRLIDSPINYVIDKEDNLLTIEYNSFKIICSIISTYKNPTDNQIERIKVIRIINVDLQSDLTKKQKYK